MLTLRLGLLGPAYGSNVALLATFMALGLSEATLLLSVVSSTTPVTGPLARVRLCGKVQDLSGRYWSGILHVLHIAVGSFHPCGNVECRFHRELSFRQ